MIGDINNKDFPIGCFSFDEPFLFCKKCSFQWNDKLCKKWRNEHEGKMTIYSKFKYEQIKIDIKCPKCEKDCVFKWQKFKNNTIHIRKECPIHGYIKYVPQTETYIKLAEQNKRYDKNKVETDKNQSILNDF